MATSPQQQSDQAQATAEAIVRKHGQLICRCGSLDPRSTRHGLSHLTWCEAARMAADITSALRAERAAGEAKPGSRVAVAGCLDRTIADFERAALVHIEEEQGRPNPDNALIAVLCDSVRLGREYGQAFAAGEAAERERRQDMLAELQNGVTAVYSDPHLTWPQARAKLAAALNASFPARVQPGFAQCPECGNLAMNPLPTCAKCGDGHMTGGR